MSSRSPCHASEKPAQEQPPDEPLPRKRGRPKGLPKTGGRKKGTKNWTAPEIRDALLGKSGAIDVLADIVARRQLYAGTSGSIGKPSWRYPTLQQRLQALQILLAKVVPDLKATELTGADGERLIPHPEHDTDPRQLARAILDVLCAAVPGGSVNIAESDFGKALHQNSDNPPDTATASAMALGGEASGASSSGAPDVSPESQDCAVGERFLIGDKGAEIVAVETEFGARKFAVYDGFGELHNFCRTRADAEALAKALSGPSLMLNPGPENGEDREG